MTLGVDLKNLDTRIKPPDEQLSRLSAPPSIFNLDSNRGFENFTASTLKSRGYAVPSPRMIKEVKTVLERDDTISKQDPSWLADAIRQIQGSSTTQQNVDKVLTTFIRFYLSNSRLPFHKALDAFFTQNNSEPRESGWYSMANGKYGLGRMRMPVACSDEEN